MRNPPPRCLPTRSVSSTVQCFKEKYELSDCLEKLTAMYRSRKKYATNIKIKLVVRLNIRQLAKRPLRPPQNQALYCCGYVRVVVSPTRRPMAPAAEERTLNRKMVDPAAFRRSRG